MLEERIESKHPCQTTAICLATLLLDQHMQAHLCRHMWYVLVQYVCKVAQIAKGPNQYRKDNFETFTTCLKNGLIVHVNALKHECTFAL